MSYEHVVLFLFHVAMGAAITIAAGYYLSDRK